MFSDDNMVFISGTTHIKTIFSFLSGTGKHFIGNALSSSKDSVTQLFHIMHFLMINNAFYNPQKKKPDESNLENKGAR
jgi:hypothetical protein